MRVRVVVAALVLLAGVACSNGDKADKPSALADRRSLCEAWQSGDEKGLTSALAKPVPGLAPGASPNEITNYLELNCDSRPDAPKRRVATPDDVAIPGLTLCDTLPVPPTPTEAESGISIFGDLSEADPYAGRMLAVMWNPSSGAHHAGDGTATPAKVHGHDAVVAPITVFQQTILPQLGTVIAWSEGGRNFGLYARGWELSQTDELVRMAESVFTADGGYAIEFMPDGFGRLFNGDARATSLILLSADPVYLVHFKFGDAGVLHAGGLDMSAEEFQAFRFFTTDVKPQRVNNRDAFVGSAWGKDGPSVVTWREPDGLVVRIVGIGVPLEKALAVGSATRELTDGEWIHLVRHDVSCSS